MIHSEIIFLEIIKLYYDTSKKNELDLERLEKAFYACQSLVNRSFSISLEYDFDTEFNKLEELCEDGILYDDNDDLILNEDILEILEDEILEFLSDKMDNTLDNFLQNIIHNYNIYQAFNIIPSYKDYECLFNMCASIVEDYKLMGLYEAKINKINPFLIKLIRIFKEHYIDIYQNYSHTDIFKLQAIIASLNEAYLLDDEIDFINSDWYVVLFGKNKLQKNMLYYSRILRSLEEEEEDYFYQEEDDILSDIDDEPYLDDEIDFFMSYYVMNLHKYIKKMPNNLFKDNLNVKKYLLLATIPHLEDYFLEVGSLDDFNFDNFNKEIITESSFSSLYLLAIESATHLFYKDNMISPDRMEEMMIRALFIRTFFDLCINKESLENIKNCIIHNQFYKNTQYKYANKLVEEIIFDENNRENPFNLSR